MNDLRADRELVIAHTMGDPGALAAIYDRYADRLYDTAAAMLRDRHEAADAMQDVFLTAAEKLGQLRDPDRLGPWLFAVLRHVVYRRSGRRGRQQLVDPTAPGSAVADVAATADPRAEGAAVSAAELAAMVRAAAAGLDTRDQLVLELTARQGLSGADLADALGVTTEQSHVLVHRMRERVERSLGALTVARMGRASCRDLADVLHDWDGRFDVLVRKRVARHIERCEVCTDTKRRYAVIPLLGASPALAAPPELREIVLGRLRGGVATSTSTAPAIEFDRRGFPTGRRVDRRLATIAAAIVVLLAVAGTTTALVATRDDGPTVAARDAGTADASAAGDPAAPTTDSSAPRTAGTADPAATTASPTTEPSAAPPSPPTSAAEPVATTVATTAPPPTTVAPTPTPPPTPATTVPPATTSAPAATTAPPVVTTAPPTTPTTAPPTTTPPPPPPPADAVPPVVVIVRAVPTWTCPWTVDPTVAAQVTDASAISGVTLSWRRTLHLGRGSTPMTELAPGEWRGSLGINRVNGVWTYTVTAIDVAGNVGTATGTIVVGGC